MAEIGLYADALLSYDELRRDFADKLIDHAGKCVDSRGYSCRRLINFAPRVTIPY